jgi:hypothetical protein
MRACVRQRPSLPGAVLYRYGRGIDWIVYYFHNRLIYYMLGVSLLSAYAFHPTFHCNGDHGQGSCTKNQFPHDRAKDSNSPRLRISLTLRA